MAIARQLAFDTLPDEDSPAGLNAFASSAFRVLLGFTPGESELTASRAALEKWRSLSSESEGRKALENARAQFILALLNHNDFVTVR